MIYFPKSKHVIADALRQITFSQEMDLAGAGKRYKTRCFFFSFYYFCTISIFVLDFFREFDAMINFEKGESVIFFAAEGKIFTNLEIVLNIKEAKTAFFRSSY